VKFLLSRKFWEGFIIAAIILVLIQTFLDEYARYARWSVSARNWLLFSGFFFDLLFSVEFTLRSIEGAKKGSFLNYIKYERGWADFLSSFPLLFLYSGPSLFLFIHGGVHSGVASYAMLNVLKVVKAVRITRILRLVRIIKILGKIHNAESRMAQHHTAVAATTAVFTVLVVLMVWSGIVGMSAQGSVEKRAADYSRILTELESISTLNKIDFRETCEGFLASDRAVMKVSYNSGKKYERISADEFSKYYSEEDYIEVSGEFCSLTVSVKDIEGEIALHHIQSFFIIIAIVFSFMLIYSRHFVQTVSDVAHVLNSGFRKKDYNLMVKIRDEYREDEIYRLARFYNDAYLPAKLKKRDREKTASGTPLTMNELMNFGKKEG